MRSDEARFHAGQTMPKAARRLPLVLLPLVLSLGPGPAHAQEASSAEVIPQTGDEVTRTRLASTLVRYAREVIGTEPLSLQGMRASMDFLKDATALDPDSASAWRLLVDLAMLTEQEDLLAESLKNLLRLEPNNASARLERFLSVLDHAGTLTEQDAMIRQLLEPASIHVVGMDVGSRLAQRLAMLDRRAGDLESFQRWLWEAVRLDPSNVEARALQAGLTIHLSESNPPLWTHVLLGLFESSLVDATSALELGLYLLNHGVYGDAARMLELARLLAEASGRDSGADLDADLALALWAAGQDDVALEVIADRRAIVDETFRQILESEGDAASREDVLEVARVSAPLPPKIAAVNAMIVFEHGDRSERDDALGEMVRATDQLEKILEDQEGQTAARVANLKRLMWLLVILDGSPGQIDEVAHRVNELQPLSEQELALLSISQNEASPDLQVDIGDGTAVIPTVGLVMADAFERSGRMRDAGELYLVVMRGDPGSLLGVLARYRLEQLLGSPIPPSDLAREISQVMRELSPTVSRLPAEPTLAVSIHAAPVHKTVHPYDPILMEVEVFNHMHRPIGISENGPIRDLVLIAPEVEIPHKATLSEIKLLLDIGRELLIPANKSVVFTIDLRETWVGSAIDASPLYGAAVDIEAILNPRVTTAPIAGTPTMLPGPLGSEVTSDALRVDGVRVTDAWVQTITNELANRLTAADLVDWALLSHAIAAQDAQQSPIVLAQGAQQTAVAAMVEAWPGLDLVSQAWLASTLAQGDRMTHVWTMIDANVDPLLERIRLMRIIKESASPGDALDDPLVVAGLTSHHESVRHLAEWIEATLQIQAETLYGEGVSSDDGTP